MIHIEFGDAGPEEIVLDQLAGWTVRVNDDVDISVTGTDTDDRGWRRLIGWQVDDDGEPLFPPVERKFPTDDLTVYIY